MSRSNMSLGNSLLILGIVWTTAFVVLDVTGNIPWNLIITHHLATPGYYTGIIEYIILLVIIIGSIWVIIYWGRNN